MNIGEKDKVVDKSIFDEKIENLSISKNNKKLAKTKDSKQLNFLSSENNSIFSNLGLIENW